MSVDPHTLLNAHQQAQQARDTLALTLSVTKHRFAPSSLKQEASQLVMDKALAGIESGKAYVRSHPIQIASFIAALGAVVGRRPLARLLAKAATQLEAHFMNRCESAHSDPSAEDVDLARPEASCASASSHLANPTD